ncbi:Hypothetical protein PHPALM_6899 [Phytophthora palmivora]|uniref:Uncharacterized protein n=1 Tax=Phytophthora palmivora TaxID=4796 RepID=A0A2P4YDP3_9STRA|nr:Hypothetical protein PHPALM_6899 [Phytophthora palmivora]
MMRAEEENETMRACGCHVGRPCTCEMGKRTASTEMFACGVCVNCRLNIRERTRPKMKLSGPRRCLKSAEYFANLAFDQVVLRENCVFRMRKPDWNVDEKTLMYNKLHQMRLAMIQTRAVSLATIDAQKKLRAKYSHDMKKTQEAVKNLEEMKMDAQTTRRMTKEHQRVDSDAFDAFSKQLIDTETLLPDLKARLEKANITIVAEQRNIKIIREYVRDFATRKLQASVRAFLRFHRWKKVLKMFQDDAQLAAVLEIQATWRMFTAKKHKLFLFQLRCDEAKTTAASVIQRFPAKIIKEKHVSSTQASAILIQRIYRGFRDRVYLKRIKIRRSLTARVGDLVDQFIVSGDFWGFVLEIDADYRRFKHKLEEEDTDAATFMSTVLRQRKLDEDQMMQVMFFTLFVVNEKVYSWRSNLGMVYCLSLTKSTRKRN